MHPIQRQAKFAAKVSSLLEEAATAGTIANEDRFLTSSEAGIVYMWCEDEMEPADCADELIRQRMAKLGAGR